ncbi:MAG: polyprenyl synthetase [Flavobacteriales bacterium]|mgnify:CR=1 FL=1|nr:polyprenyl synthetase [Flavobacteriales bacterium]
MHNHSHSFKKIMSVLTAILNDILIQKEPTSLYDPVNYLLKKKGKNTRALLALIASNFWSVDVNQIRNLILAIESLHNFSLIHDDVMDNALIRRGAPTINSKWSNNQAILSGDVLLIHAYRHLLKSNFSQEILNYFTQTAIEICEGQQLDLDLQKTKIISLDQYYKMIYLKTGVLIRFALTAPCFLSKKGSQYLDEMNKLGDSLGILFQIQDDYLDLYGQESKTGKLLGGDVFENKKTFLYAIALDLSTKTQQQDLIKSYHSQGKNKLEEVYSVFNVLGVKRAAELKIEELSSIILETIKKLDIHIDKKNIFLEFISTILNRKK